MSKLPKRIRAAEACEATGLTLRGLQVMAARGEIPGAAKMGRIWTFDSVKLGEWIQEKERATAQRAMNAASFGLAEAAQRRAELASLTSNEAYERAIGLKRR